MEEGAREVEAPFCALPRRKAHEYYFFPYSEMFFCCPDVNRAPSSLVASEVFFARIAAQCLCGYSCMCIFLLVIRGVEPSSLLPPPPF